MYTIKEELKMGLDKFSDSNPQLVVKNVSRFISKASSGSLTPNRWCGESREWSEGELEGIRSELQSLLEEHQAKL